MSIGSSPSRGENFSPYRISELAKWIIPVTRGEQTTFYNRKTIEGIIPVTRGELGLAMTVLAFVGIIPVTRGEHR